MNLMQKLERLVDLLIAHYEQKTDLSGLTPPPVQEAKPERKPRAKKIDPASLVVPVVSADPLMQSESPVPTREAVANLASVASANAGAVVMTEEQSLERAKELAKKIVEAYPEKEAATNRPKGFRLAMELLAKHKVARTTDLIHSQRIQFIAEGEALIAAAATVGA